MYSPSGRPGTDVWANVVSSPLINTPDLSAAGSGGSSGIEGGVGIDVVDDGQSVIVSNTGVLEVLNGPPPGSGSFVNLVSAPDSTQTPVVATLIAGLGVTFQTPQSGQVIVTATGGGSGITQLTSTGGSILVTGASGPTTNVETVIPERQNAATQFFIGTNAGTGFVTGTSNVAVGSQGLGAIGTGSFNLALGNQALAVLASGAQNTAVGHMALSQLTSTSNNTAVGYNSQALSTSSVSNNTAVGSNSLVNNAGDSNTAVGASAMTGPVSGVGGASNVAVGFSALQAIDGGASNVAVGATAGAGLASGSSNVFVGAAAGSSAATNFNVGVGASALAQSLGAGNVAIGHTAGSVTTIGNSNIFIGYLAGTTGAVADFSNCIVLGANASPLVSGDFVLGSSGNPVNTNTTAAAGSAVLPSAPVGFLKIVLNGTAQHIPYYS
eukprot:gnl/Hemi2/5010_TR1731_c0_g1_i1.p1 gnl/Hemi2/5010_TR1731_c0_g1~~gnl/Hemi2/5010_TR1731_c0_g1_i1.p1  ORF type:complete len:439 (+),score=48.92 gnl/Hemi2/5010_TR1731_c0_g1_i1:45-1361(+)